MKEIADKLPEGGAATFVLVREATTDKVVPEIAKYGGQVIQSSLFNEQEAALQEALDNRAWGSRARAGPGSADVTRAPARLRGVDRSRRVFCTRA
jgi:uncharacterized protein DUF1269